MCVKAHYDFSESYVDHIGVGSDGWSQHINHIRRSLGINKEVGMPLNIENCELAKSEVRFVGDFVGSRGRKPDPERLESLDKMYRLLSYRVCRLCLLERICEESSAADTVTSVSGVMW